MFRRRKTEAVDPLLTDELPTRAQIAHSRMEHQYDPALLEALSERELAYERQVAERVRDHSRRETEQRLEAAESAAAQVRRATAEIVRADAQDLVTARKALAEQRRQSSPHAQLASLYRIKTFSSRALAGVVVAAMLWSAVNVQQNIAPTGAGDPLFWASYLLEALISTVLVVFMGSGSAVAHWKITEGEDRIKRIEIALLAATITLNTYPYFTPLKIWDIVVHAVAPVMIGVALFGHDAVGKRLGAAIDEASRQLPPEDDIAVRLATLTDVTRPVPAITPAEPASEGAPESWQVHSDTDTPAPAAAETNGVQVHPHSEMHPANDVQVHPVPNQDAQSVQVHTEVHPADDVQVHPQPDLGTGGVHLHPEAPATPEQPALKVSLVKPVTDPVHPAEVEDVHRTRSARTGADDSAALAVELVRRGETTKPAEEVAEVLAQAARGIAPTTIAKNTGIHHKTIGKILSSAEQVRRPRPAVVGGGRVIELDRRNAQ